jgi:hypothetical protein
MNREFSEAFYINELNKYDHITFRAQNYEYFKYTLLREYNIFEMDFVN